MVCDLKSDAETIHYKMVLACLSLYLFKKYQDFIFRQYGRNTTSKLQIQKQKYMLNLS